MNALGFVDRSLESPVMETLNVIDCFFIIVLVIVLFEITNNQITNKQAQTGASILMTVNFVRVGSHVFLLSALAVSFAEAMFSKKELPSLDGLPAAKRFRNNMADLCMGNEISSQRVLTVLQDAAAAGAQGIADLLGNTSSSSASAATKESQKRNAGRDLTRRLLKNKSNGQLHIYLKYLCGTGKSKLPPKARSL